MDVRLFEREGDREEVYGGRGEDERGDVGRSSYLPGIVVVAVLCSRRAVGLEDVKLGWCLVDSENEFDDGDPKRRTIGNRRKERGEAWPGLRTGFEDDGVDDVAERQLLGCGA